MIDGLLSAFSFLTILPVGRPAGAFTSQPGAMFSYFPLVGLLIGAVAGLVASIRFLPGDLTAFLTLAAWVALTGGLHLDGLADACDGLLSTASPECRLEIMKDPRAGSWAVIGVSMLLLGKWVALRAVPPALLLIPPIAGRWAMALAAAAFPGARTSGLAAGFRVGFGRRQFIAASAVTVVLIAALGAILGWHLIALLAIPPLVVLAVGGWAARRLGGGLTGDVYGALCELVELICLIGLNLG
jgi:adenosylcobinamide-GDP ribazoletransferase